MSRTTGSGTFECPLCHQTVRFLIDVEVDERSRFYSSRAKGVADDHAPECKAYAPDPKVRAS